MADFKVALKKVLNVEGRYVNDPNDPGGETNWGITVKVARRNGYSGSMEDMTKEDAEKIYKKKYWDKLRADDIGSQLVADELMDIKVNGGYPVLWLQVILNALNRDKDWEELEEDGRIGSKTIDALNKAIQIRLREENTAKALNCYQCIRFIEISRNNPKLESFVNGWISKRVSL